VITLVCWLVRVFVCYVCCDFSAFTIFVKFGMEHDVQFSICAKCR